MRINEELAQEISGKIMREIPYNVNIMNEKGIIIGSGNSERIGTLHNGAALAIKNKQMVTLYESSEGGQPGVNIPITYLNKIIGVVGISGNPDIVKPLAKIVKVTVELLIHQNALNTERHIKERMKVDFLFQWTMRSIPYDKEFINHGSTVEIDVLTPRFALVVKGLTIKELNILGNGEYALPLNEDTYIYLLKTGKNLNSLIPKILKQQKVYIGVGKTEPIISTSIQQALRMINITQKMKWDNSTIFYEQHEMIDRLLQSNLVVSDIVGKIDELAQTEKGIVLIETLKHYIEESGNINEIANKLHLHRNSLNYRLDRIEAMFNLNPRKFDQLFFLYLGLVFYLCRD